jgi:hypothetical protein
VNIFGRKKAALPSSFVAALDDRIRLIALQVFAEMEAKRSTIQEEALARELAKPWEQVKAEMAEADREWEAKRNAQG